MTYTDYELATALKSDGCLLNGEKTDFIDDGIITGVWYEGDVGDAVSTLEYGDFEIVEHRTGQTGVTDEFNGGYTVWKNWIVLKQGDRYFKLEGEDDSWDPQGWDGRVTEVEPVEKVITVWGVKVDY